MEKVIGMIDVISGEIDITLMLKKLGLHACYICDSYALTLELVHMPDEDRLISVEASLEKSVCEGGCGNDYFCFGMLVSYGIYYSLDIFDIIIGLCEGIVTPERYDDKIVETEIYVFLNGVSAPFAVLTADRGIMKIYLTAVSMLKIFYK